MGWWGVGWGGGGTGGWTGHAITRGCCEQFFWFCIPSSDSDLIQNFCTVNCCNVVLSSSVVPFCGLGPSLPSAARWYLSCCQLLLHDVFFFFTFLPSVKFHCPLCCALLQLNILLHTAHGFCVVPYCGCGLYSFSLLSSHW